MGCHALLQGIFHDAGIEPTSLMSSVLASRFFTPNATWEAHLDFRLNVNVDSVSQSTVIYYTVINCQSLSWLRER